VELNLGVLDVPREKWKELANAIESYVHPIGISIRVMSAGRATGGRVGTGSVRPVREVRPMVS
jgi:hypothetical protein